MNKATKWTLLCWLLPLAMNPHILSANERAVARIIEQARSAIGAEADLNKLSSLQLVGQLTPVAADQPSARLVVIAQKPSFHRFELRYEHLVETTLCDGHQASILRAQLPDGRPQMRWLDTAQVEAINHSMHHLFNFYQANLQSGESIHYAGTIQRHQQSCHRVVYRYPDGRQTIRYFNQASGRLVSVVDWNGREAEVVSWSRVQGVYYPKRIAFSRQGKALHTIDYTQIVANNHLDDRLFAMPEIDKKN